MEWDEVTIALQFFAEGDEGIVIQCPLVRDIPYIKRFIIEHLGTPSKSIHHSIYYDGKPIHFVASTQSDIFSRDYARHTLFYIGCRQGGDSHTVLQGISVMPTYFPVEPMSLWQCMGLSPSEVVECLLQDGYTGEEVSSVLFDFGLLGERVYE